VRGPGAKGERGSGWREEMGPNHFTDLNTSSKIPGGGGKQSELGVHDHRRAADGSFLDGHQFFPAPPLKKGHFSTEKIRLRAF